MREKKIEEVLVRTVKKRGGLCPKLMSPGMAGMPDRMVLLPGGKVGFVEVKTRGEIPRPLQLHRHRQLRGLDFKVFVLDEIERIGGLLDEIEKE